MSLICPHCHRANQSDAIYCYFDGSSLIGAAGPLAAATESFATPFVFPAGKSCKSFDEFAETCLNQWGSALELLKSGHIQAYFGGIGRMDIAQSAQEAAHFPDCDRGLDQFISRLPTSKPLLPKLDVLPKLIDLGTVQVGSQKTILLHMVNQGSRLVFGSISSSARWLAPTETGEARLFQFRDSAKIEIQLKGQHLRAGSKSLEGDLLIESNGGTFKLKVVVQVPIVPFPMGALQGARTPREIAEKAKAQPKLAGALFADGSVAKWYQSNGWIYPVQGPASNGVAAVQQFFEALGLSKPPKVTINTQRVQLAGKPGAKLTYQLQVSTEDNRPVFAHAASSEPWLNVSAGVAHGKSTTLALDITVPDRAGEKISTTLLVTSNGQQRFVVPVELTVQTNASIAAALPPPLPNVNTKSSPDLAVVASKSKPSKRETASADPGKMMIHIAPLVLLGLVLVGLLTKDVFSDNSGHKIDDGGAGQHGETQFAVAIQDEPDEHSSGAPVARFRIDDEPEERIGPAIAPVKFEIKDEPEEISPNKNGTKSVPIDPTLRIAYQATAGNWGLTDTSTNKLLTYSPVGSTNRTMIRVAGITQAFNGVARGLPDDPLREARQRTSYVSNPRPGLRVTKFLEIVPSKQPVEINNQPRRLMDTLLVRYLYENVGKQQINAGLRLEVDTLIGGNDGVPFTVPGRGLVNTSADFTEPKLVPDFVQALETGNLRNPGTIVHVSLKVGGKVEAPSRVTLCHWARNGDLSNIIPSNMGSDSAIVMVWPDQMLAPGKSREMGYAYGLGSVTVADPGGTLAVTLGGNFDIGQSFTISAYVNKPVPGQTLSLELPAGLDRIKGEPTQQVPPPNVGTTSIVSWEAKVLRTGVFPVRVRSSTGITQTKTITIAQGDAPTGGKLRLELVPPFEPGKNFTVRGHVSEPVPGQTLTLHLPAGLQKVAGELTQALPAPAPGSKDTVVNWTIRVNEAGRFPVRVSSSNGIAQTKTITIADASRAEGAFQIELVGEIVPGKTFIVATKVANPIPDQRMQLILPAGLQRMDGAETQTALANAKVAWTVKVQEAGKFTIAVKSTNGVTQRKTVMIEPPNNLAGRFDFDFNGTIRPGKQFTVRAQVNEPVAGQKLTLHLPKGLQLASGAPTASVPAPTAGISQVSWHVQVLESGRLPIRIESSTGLARAKTITLSETTSTLFGR